jgi:hypothetical protein
MSFCKSVSTPLVKEELTTVDASAFFACPCREASTASDGPEEAEEAEESIEA